MQVRTPGLIWAERDDCLYLTVTVAETTDLKYNIEDGQQFHVSFRGRDSEEYVLDLELLKKVDPATSRIKTTRHIEFKLMKVEPGFWNKLYNGPKERHIGIDWSKWVDEDDSGDEGGAGNSFNWGDGDAMNIPQFQKGDVNEDLAMEQMLAKMQAEKGAGAPDDDDDDDIDDIEDLDDLPDVADMPGLVDDQ